MSVFEWWSRHEIVALDGGSLFVSKYVDSIRKQAALVVRDGGQQVAVAYFRDEEVARDIAERFFGGVVTP